MCIFCKIINKEIPANILCETDELIVLADINPISDGHLLVVPKIHFENYLDIDKNISSEIQKITRKMCDKISETLKPTGFHVITNIGSAQEVKHCHFHIIPVYNDKVLDLKHTGNKSKITEITDMLK